MRFKKTIVFSFIVLVIFLTYLFFHDQHINYVALGDSLAAGQNPYGEKKGYGYADYIKDYLEENELLKQYIKDYATSGFTTDDILEDLKNNKKINVNGHEMNLRKALRESDLVTISVGANDFMKNLQLEQLDLSNTNLYIEKIDLIMYDVGKVLKEVRKFAKNKVVVIGYYNPFPLLFKTSEKELDAIFRYIDQEYEGVCSLYNVNYVSVYELFKNNSDFLPNPFDIHPNLNGYQAIAGLIIEKNLR